MFERSYKHFHSVDDRDHVDFGQHTQDVVCLASSFDGISMEDAAIDVDGNPWVYAVVAFEGRGAVGYGTLRLSGDSYLTSMYGDIAELNDAFVFPIFRREGIYKKLLEERMQYARNLGLNAVFGIPKDPESPHVAYLQEQGFSFIAHPDFTTPRVLVKELG